MHTFHTSAHIPDTAFHRGLLISTEKRARFSPIHPHAKLSEARIFPGCEKAWLYQQQFFAYSKGKIKFASQKTPCFGALFGFTQCSQPLLRRLLLIPFVLSYSFSVRLRRPLARTGRMGKSSGRARAETRHCPTKQCAHLLYLKQLLPNHAPIYNRTNTTGEHQP